MGDCRLGLRIDAIADCGLLMIADCGLLIDAVADGALSIGIADCGLLIDTGGW
jgi:hypothetical protein